MSFAARGEARDMEFATTWKQRYIQLPSRRSDAPVSAFLPFSLAVGHGRFPALADGTFHVLGLLEDSNQRNKLFFRERVVINSKCCKVRADFLFLGAALKMYGLHQLLQTAKDTSKERIADRLKYGKTEQELCELHALIDNMPPEIVAAYRRKTTGLQNER